MTPDTGQIDQLDVKLIEALREDPRVGLLEIARRVGVARGTVQARLARLEARGGLPGSGPEVEAARMGYPIAAFVFVELNQGRLTEAAEAARAVPEGLEGDAVSGQQDLIGRGAAGGRGQQVLARRGARAPPDPLKGVTKGVGAGRAPPADPAPLRVPAQ